jgi:hypothetical protein
MHLRNSFSGDRTKSGYSPSPPIGRQLDLHRPIGRRLRLGATENPEALFARCCFGSMELCLKLPQLDRPASGGQRLP